MDADLEIQQPDEARSPKRARLDGALEVTEDLNEEMVDNDDLDDIYGAADDAKSDAKQVNKETTARDTSPIVDATTMAQPGSGPHDTNAELDPSTVDVVNHGEALISEERNAGSINTPAVHEELSGVNRDLNASVTGFNTQDDHSNTPVAMDTSDENSTHIEKDGLTGSTSKALQKVTEDAEFMEAAAAQKGSKQAEWQFDSSDAETSSDSDSDSSDSTDSDDDSEGGYEMLDPATAAKILMAADGEDEDGEGKKKSGKDDRPRTQHEAKEEVVVRPDVVITETTKLTELGHIERVVENMALIKANTSGEYQVLESGSVLCNEKREVIGSVLETFGRVQEPMYSVQFTNQDEIKELGMDYGSKIFYADQHSTFVFTQPLKNLKGTDASNFYDEEVAEDEIEFSDDEAEAEYKRQKKLAKKAARGGAQQQFRGGARSFGAPGHDSGATYIHRGDAPQQTYGGGMSYDDEPGEEFYQPLKRPENLTEMMAGGRQSGTERTGDRGRGRGRGRGDRGGRGRGDRGRGRGGFDNHRGGRGANAQQPPHRGSAQSFPDHHNQTAFAANPQASYSTTQAPSQFQPQPPAPSTYQFNGYTFQYGVQAPPMPQANYYPQFQQQAASFTPQQAYPNPPPQWQQWQQTTQQAQTQQHGQSQQPQQQGQGAETNLANILRQLGGQQQ